MYEAIMLAPSNVEREIAHNGQAARIEAKPIPEAEAAAVDLFKEIFFNLKIEIVKMTAFKKDAIKINKIFGRNTSQATICFNNSKSCNGSLYNSKKNERSSTKKTSEKINKIK